MRRASPWSRNPLSGMRRIMALVLSALLLWCAVSRAATVTPRGVQCPTAAVQAVAVVKRDCCGRLLCVVRKPREGERGFVQCRCAERKVAGHGPAEPATPRVEAAFAAEAPLALALPARLPEPRAEDTYLARLTTVVTPPSVRPPQAA